MTTHDSLATQIISHSCYETRFQKIFSLLQTDLSLLRLFLGDPGPRLAGMGIPVVKSLEDVEFVSSSGDGGHTGSELLQIKLHWWGVEAMIGVTLINYVRDSMEAGGCLEQIVSPSAKGSLAQEMIRTICNDLKGVVDLCCSHTPTGKKNYWRVPWIQWSTGVPMELLIHFASRPLSC